MDSLCRQRIGAGPALRPISWRPRLRPGGIGL